jgi:hypothetical protein
VIKEFLEFVPESLKLQLVLHQALKVDALDEVVLVGPGWLRFHRDLEVHSSVSQKLELLLVLLLELIDYLFLNSLSISFALEEQLVLNLVRHPAFDEVAHVLPIGSLISGSLPLRKLNLPISHLHFSWLGGVEILDDFIIFLLKCFNGRVNLERNL